MNDRRIAIIGAGGWGTALAVLLANEGRWVTLWTRREEVCARLQQTRANQQYLPGISIPENVAITTDPSACIQGANAIIVAVPSQKMRSVLSRFRGIVDPDQRLVSAAKGIERETLKRMSEVVNDVLPRSSAATFAVLSGPNHAEEVAQGVPTTSVIACRDPKNSEILQDLLMTPQFRVYTNPDVVGVEMAGSLKNIIALAAGISDGLGFGSNTRAALITRGLAEITRLGLAHGATRETFAGLAGMGDLIGTCTSRHSRNRGAGLAIGGGEKPSDVEERSAMVIEGIPTTAAALKLARRYGVEMPITQKVYNILFQDENPLHAVEDLMTRGPKAESTAILGQ